MSRAITIVIPVYNAAKTLARCVESISAQSERDWKLILVDDGSNDSSAEICDSYQLRDSRITALHKPNGGAGSARNYGLIHCTTDWVTFVDADDTIEPDYLANFNLDENKEKEDVVIMQGFRRVSPDFEELDEKISLMEADYTGTNLLSEAFFNDKIFEYGQSVGKLYMVSTIHANSIHFPDRFSLSEDHYFYLSYLLAAKEIVTYPGTKYNYIWEETAGLSRKAHPYPQLLERYRALTELCKRLKNAETFPPTILRQIDYFATTGSLSLLLQSLFRQEKDRQKRKAILSEILFDKPFLRSTFFPHNLKGRLLKWLMLTAPTSFTDLLLSKSLKS